MFLSFQCVLASRSPISKYHPAIQLNHRQIRTIDLYSIVNTRYRLTKLVSYWNGYWTIYQSINGFHLVYHMQLATSKAKSIPIIRYREINTTNTELYWLQSPHGIWPGLTVAMYKRSRAKTNNILICKSLVSFAFSLPSLPVYMCYGFSWQNVHTYSWYILPF